MKNIFLLLITLSISGQLFAQRPPKPTNEKIQALKVAIFTEELALTTKEAKSFWPLYNEYETKVKKIDKENRRISTDLETKSDKEIEAGMEKHFQLKEQKINLEREYYKKFKKVIPLQKVAKIAVAQRKFKRRLVGEMRRQGKGGRQGKGANRN
jgi:hypothetical protein